jgi:hypothetical protein
MKNLKLLSILLLSSLFIFEGCKPTKKSESVSIESVKESALKGDKTILEKEVTIEGYYWNETVPLLLTNLEILNLNTPMAEKDYIVLAGAGMEKISKDDKFQGAYIKITGKLRVTKNDKNRLTEIDLICPEIPIILKPRVKDFIIPSKLFDICKLNPRWCDFRPLFIKNKYAILYSGGINSANAHLRYWNDLQFMYLTLKNKYGYSDANIIVVYKDGVAANANMPVDYAATTTGFRNAIDFLKAKMTINDDLFVFVTNHGAGYHKGGGHQAIATAGNRGGTADANADEIDPQHIDENIFYYGQANNNFLDDNFASMIKELSFKRMISVLEPCFSGGLLHDLGGPKSIVISASDEFQFSYGGASSGGVSYDVFSYFFTEALNNAAANGAALTTNPDTNGDGKISILEAFNYAKLKDTADEIPHLEDSGDGIGTNTPTSGVGDGFLSNTTFL